MRQNKGRNFLNRTNFNRQYRHNNEHKNYLNIPDKFKKLLKVKWPKPSVLSNAVLQQISLDKFKYSEKIDGVHTFLLIFDKQFYNVTDLSKIYQIKEKTIKDFNFSGECIIETEFYDNIYYIFDVYYLNGENYSPKFLDDRLNSINKYIEELGPSFKIKKFSEIQNLDELIEYIKKDRSPEGIYIDGVILQRIDKPYFPENKEPNSYKFKPKHLNTIDFLLKYDYEYKSYDLYLLGKYHQDFKNNIKLLPKEKDIYRPNDIDYPINGRRYRAYNNSKILIYFDSSFYPNLGTMELTLNWNKENYTTNQIEIINKLINKMKEKPGKYHNSIVELSLTNDKKWVPYKLRKDKTLPNSYKVGLSNISIIFDPIKPLNDIYFQKNLTMSKDKLNIIHEINQTFRKYIIEKYVSKYGTNSSVLDLCGGRGADEFNLYSNGVSNFFVIDNDTTALKRYFDRTLYINNKKYKPLTTIHSNKSNWININLLNHKLDKNYNDIIKDLQLRYEFYRKKVDIVIMNYAIHYLCDDEEKITKLSEFVNNILFNDGIFIVTYFDGDEIIQRKKDNISKIGPFDIEIIKEEKDVTIAKMPLPTIKEGQDIYSEEPLVKQETINKLETHLKKKYENFYVYDECKNYVDEIKGFEEYIDYYKLIKVGIYCKKNNH